MTESQSNQWPADKIVRKNVSKLVFYARNSRTHSDEQVNQLAASIKEWGPEQKRFIPACAGNRPP